MIQVFHFQVLGAPIGYDTYGLAERFNQDFDDGHGYAPDEGCIEVDEDIAEEISIDDKALDFVFRTARPNHLINAFAKEIKENGFAMWEDLYVELNDYREYPTDKL